jgi:GNAT superfamily N-acetyltransferase
VPIAVRRITDQDGRILREVRLRALLDSPAAFGTRYEDAVTEAEAEWTATARASARGNRRAYFFALDDERADELPVGMVQARRRPPVDCLLFSMWVAPQVRQVGVGKALVDTVADWGAGWGARRVILWVTGVNEGAQRFYDRIGFRLLVEGDDADSGRRYGALAMVREIAP